MIIEAERLTAVDELQQFVDAMAQLSALPAPSLIDAAIARQQQRPARRIDYDLMRREFPKQKAALGRAVKTGDAEKVAAACKAAIAMWDEAGAWPDDWSRWQRALDDVLPLSRQIDIKDL